MADAGEFIAYVVSSLHAPERHWAICEEHRGCYFHIAMFDDFDDARRERSRLAWERPGGLFGADGNFRRKWPTP
jgi:hypothetical protein